MQSILLALLSGAVALSAAYTTPVGDSPVGNAILTPAMGEPVPAGRPYTIKWDPTTEGTVTILLLRGPSTNIKPLYPIVEKITNLGSYIWTPSTSLEADTTHYGIQIIDDESGQYQYSSQFGIKNDNPTTSSTTSSSVSSAAYGSVTPAPESSSVVVGTIGYGNGTTVNVTSNVTVCTQCPPGNSSYIAPTGAPVANSSVVQPTGNMTVPATIRTSTTATRVTPPSTVAASASASSSTAAAFRVAGSLGSAVVGALGAAAIFL
ncbi:MAG: hypothetical protein M1817_002220 [Caeruleum heppii]|nr:MAG: hypothetical protein M1817_002220 [Caeruleum heppii]